MPFGDIRRWNKVSNTHSNTLQPSYHLSDSYYINFFINRWIFFALFFTIRDNLIAQGGPHLCFMLSVFYYNLSYASDTQKKHPFLSFITVSLRRLTLWHVSCLPCWWLFGFGSTSIPVRPVPSSDMWWPLCWASTWLSSALAGESPLCLSRSSVLVISVLSDSAPTFLPSYSITLVTLFSCKQRACPSFMLWLYAFFFLIYLFDFTYGSIISI